MEVTYVEEASSSQEKKKRLEVGSAASSSQAAAVTVGQSECFWSQQDGGLIYHDGNGFMFCEIGIQNSTR